MNTNISVILTCYNRKDKTTACLTSLAEAYNRYNTQHQQSPIHLSIYLTDDGCTDGTADAVEQLMKLHPTILLHIIKGNGHCYWAGGMRLAWNAALKAKEDVDFFLLINDDTVLRAKVFEELLSAHQFALKNYGKGGLYSGITCDINDPGHITYGGKQVSKSDIRATYTVVGQSAEPQPVDITNANILMVDKNVVNELGIFYKGYIHGGADYDYSLLAHKHGFPVLLTAGICGECEYDHLIEGDEIKKLAQMTLRERIKYVNFPTHCDQDYFTLIKRHYPHKLLACWILRKIRILAPNLYGWINKKRQVNGY